MQLAMLQQGCLALPHSVTGLDGTWGLLISRHFACSLPLPTTSNNQEDKFSGEDSAPVAALPVSPQNSGLAEEEHYQK